MLGEKKFIKKLVFKMRKSWSSGWGSLGGLAQLKISCCHKLPCRWHIWLGSGIAVAVVQAGSCSCDLTAAQEIPYASGSVLKRKKRKKKKKEEIYQKVEQKDKKMENRTELTTKLDNLSKA